MCAVEELEKVFQGDTWMDLWLEEYIHVWRKIGMWECYNYLIDSLDSFRLWNAKFLDGKKVLDNILHSLNYYSIYQTNYLVYLAVKNAAAYSVSKGNIYEAVNSIPNGIRRNVDRARAGAWEITSYRRIPRKQLSSITETLFYTVLKIGEDGFTKRIC